MLFYMQDATLYTLSHLQVWCTCEPDKKSSWVCPFQQNDSTAPLQIFASHEFVLRFFPAHHLPPLSFINAFPSAELWGSIPFVISTLPCTVILMN